MGLGSGWHWILFLLVAVLLFGGGGKISSLMGDVAKGIKSFKKGMSEDDAARGRRAQQDRLKPRPCRGRLRRWRPSRRARWRRSIFYRSVYRMGKAGLSSGVPW